MASVFHLCFDSENIKEKIVLKYRNFAESDKKLFVSSVAIQRTWRGYVVRKMIKDWNKKATRIQKVVRGWLVRLHLPQYYNEYYHNLSVAHYNECAIKIQSNWRGYMTRKTAVSVRDVLAERKEIEFLSTQMQERLRTMFQELHKKDWNEEQQYLKKVLRILFDRHHLLRTKSVEGVFSIHGSDNLSCIEEMLKSFPMTEYMRKLRKAKTKK